MTRPTPSGCSPPWCACELTWTRRSSGKGARGADLHLKDELVDPETYARTSGASSGAANSFDEVLSAVYTRYQARLREAHALDFDDLIMTTVNLP